MLKKLKVNPESGGVFPLTNDKQKQDILKELSYLPPENASKPLWKYIPMIWPPFGFRWRLLKLIICGSEDLREGLALEWQLHVLVDTLFLSILAAPIFSGLLLCTTLYEIIVGVLFFTTICTQIVSIITHAILVSHLFEIPRNMVSIWCLQKIDGLSLAATIHSTGFYLFSACIYCWPFVLLSWLPATLCTLSALTVTILFSGSFGIGGKLFKIIYPNIMLTFNPRDKNIRKIAENDILFLDFGNFPLLQPNNESIDKPSDISKQSYDQWNDNKKSISEYLSEIEMSHYIDSFVSQNITIDMLPLLTNDDFRDLGVKIGDRLRIQCKR